MSAQTRPSWGDSARPSPTCQGDVTADWDQFAFKLTALVSAARARGEGGSARGLALCRRRRRRAGAGALRCAKASM